LPVLFQVKSKTLLSRRTYGQNAELDELDQE